MEDIHDIKGMIEILPFWQEHLILSIMLAAFVLSSIIASIYFLIKKFNTPPPPTPEPYLTPYEKAIKELPKTIEFMKPGMDKLLSIKISDIIRNYLENAFNLHVSEKTSEEFLYNIQEEMIFSPKSLNTLASFLELSDLAKFAKVEFTSHDQKILYDKAFSFLNLAHQEEPKNASSDSIHFESKSA